MTRPVQRSTARLVLRQWQEEDREAFAAMNADPVTDPAELFTHVYTEPTAALRKQAAWLADELADAASEGAS